MDFVCRTFFSFNRIGFFTTYSKNSPLKFEYIFGNISFIVLFIAVLLFWFDFSDTKYASKKLKSFCMIVANLSLTCLLLMRWWESGHFPLSNLYESLLGLSWSFTTVHLIVTLNFTKKLERDFGGENDKIGAITAPTALLTSVFATFFLPPEMLRATTLIPALKSNWLTMHVTVMIVSYAFLLVGSLLSIAFCAYKISTKVIQSSSNRDNSLEQWATQKSLYNYLTSDTDKVRSAKAQALSKEPVDISEKAKMQWAWKANQNQILGSRKLCFGFGLKLLPVRNAILNTRAFRWKTEPTSSFDSLARQSTYQATIQAVKNNQPQKKILDISLQHLGSSDFLECQQLSNNLKKKQNNLQFFYPRVQNLESSNLDSTQTIEKNSIFNTATEYSNSNKKKNSLGLNFFSESNKKSITKNILSVQKSLDFINLKQKNSLTYLNKKAQTQTEHEKIQLDVCIWLNTMSYRILGLGFPLLTIGILSGAVWANEAWGSYWSWDPKETWALITWLVFAIYFHSRYYRSSDTSIIPASIASIGFFVIWICYLGVNLLQSGLHSYGWFALLVSL